MDKDRPENLGDELLARYLSPPEKMDAYRKEVSAMLQKEQAALGRQKRMVLVIWLIVVGLSTTFMVVGSMRSSTLGGVWLGISACFWLLFGTVFLTQLHFNRIRLELLKEVKQVQVQLLELHNRAK